MFSRFDGDKLSLNDICNELDDKFGCEIAKQSVNERFNTEAIGFLRKVISQSITEKLDAKSAIRFSGYFSAIRIQDSTSFQIPKNLSDHYGGCGGAASGALARIQFEYDLKSMDVTTLELTPGSYQDVSFSKDKVGSIKKGELVIRDLGYISGAFLRDIIKQEAFFLNRLRSKQIVYIKDNNGKLVPLNFARLLKAMDQRKLRSDELEIFLEIEGEYVAMRLIAEKMPDDVYAGRIRKAEKEAKKKGRKLTTEYKIRARLNLFITNVEKQVLSTRDIGYLYSFRWQIELIFKSWKSTFSIDRVKTMKKERFECQIYARLLLIIICWKIFSLVNNAVVMAHNLNAMVMLSYFKFNKLIYARLESFMLAVIHRGMWMHRFLLSVAKNAMGENQNIEPKNKTMASVHIFEMINNLIDIETVACGKVA